MSPKNMRLVLVVLLGIVFLAGQFHFCADVSSEPFASHFCPICATAGTAIVTATPSIAIIPVSNRLETPAIAFDIFSDAPRTTSPRAPPSL
jgi:hypothetical protein